IGQPAKRPESTALLPHKLTTLTTCLPGTYTPFFTRPILSFQRCLTLNDNCAVMQDCTHMTFLSFFSHK
ncbi:unnamed protein product, partial [Staurois parvus]